MTDNFDFIQDHIVNSKLCTFLSISLSFLFGLICDVFRIVFMLHYRIENPQYAHLSSSLSLLQFGLISDVFKNSFYALLHVSLQTQQTQFPIPHIQEKITMFWYDRIEKMPQWMLIFITFTQESPCLPSFYERPQHLQND